MKSALLLLGVLSALATVPAWLVFGAMAGILALTATNVLLALFLIFERMEWAPEHGVPEGVLEARSGRPQQH